MIPRSGVGFGVGVSSPPLGLAGPFGRGIGLSGLTSGLVGLSGRGIGLSGLTSGLASGLGRIGPCGFCGLALIMIGPLGSILGL